jgi:tetratricopeptide (TPR) repeat protein
MTTINNLFELGIELRDKGDLKDSINVFSKILNDYPNDKKRYVVYTVLGGIHSDLREYDKSLINFKSASDLNPKYELASLGQYLAYVKLDRDDEAIGELIRYLKIYPAKLYKDTLEELLEGLEKGYMTNYKDEIENLAKINEVKFLDR